MLAEAVGLSEDEDEKANGDTLSIDKLNETIEEDVEPRKNLELFVSKRSGNVYVGESSELNQQTPKGTFERVRIESTE